MDIIEKIARQIEIASAHDDYSDSIFDEDWGSFQYKEKNK